MDHLRTLLDLGIPRPWIAARLGVSPTAVHYWLTGARQLSQGHVLKLALLVADMKVRLAGLPLTTR